MWFSVQIMFWASIEESPFKGVSLNASVVRFLLSEVEDCLCEDIDRIEKITMAIDTDIHQLLCNMAAVPDMTTLFLKHYIDTAGKTLEPEM